LKGLLDEQVADRMRTAIRAANGAIFQRTLTEHDKRGMGTTVTALVLFGTRFLIGQVGDSRAYLYRDGKLIQLTKDHSYVQEQVDDLIAEANRHGGLDNITAIIVRIDAVDAPVGDTTQITQPGGRARPR